MNRKSKIWIICLIIVFVFQSYLFAITPLPRIKTRIHAPYGEFYMVGTAQSFSPVGHSLVKLVYGSDMPYHGNFIEFASHYCPAKIEHDLTKMRAAGYNVVRCWINVGNNDLNALGIYGVGGPKTYNGGPDLYAPYMDNVIDFLERCTSHKMYVIFCMDGTPFNHYYNLIAGENDGTDHLEGTNRNYLAEGAITAKKIFLEEFVNWIKDEDPDLLPTVFSYEIDNEIFCTTDREPFSSGSPEWVLTADGASYHMTNYDVGSPTGRQACMDNNINHWANECVASIKSVDPDALVSVSVFPFDPVGKSGPNGLWPIVTNDRRWPARPLKLRMTNLSFTDIHFYLPWDMDDCLASMEWSSLPKTSKPFFVGEFGAHRADYSLSGAGDALYAWRKDFYSHGFSGSSLFTFDTLVPDTVTRYDAMEGGKYLLNLLSLYAYEKLSGFKTAGVRDGWTTMVNIDAWSVSNGKLIISNTVSPPQIQNNSCAIDSTLVKFVKVRMKNNTSATHMTLYWLANTDSTWNEDKALWLTCTANDATMKEYVFDMSNIADWNGTITNLRLMPIRSATGLVEIDYILATSSPAGNSDIRSGPNTFGTWTMESVVGNPGYVPDEDSTRANNLLRDAAPQTPSRVSGGYGGGYALSFNGGERARSSDHWNTNFSNLVFECRINTDNIWSSTNQWFLNLNKGIVLSCHDRRFYMRIYSDDTNYVEVCTSSNYLNDNYYLIKAAVCADGTFALWIEDEANSTSESISGKTSTGSWNRLSNEYIYLGASRYSSMFFDGKLDNVTIWSF